MSWFWQKRQARLQWPKKMGPSDLHFDLDLGLSLGQSSSRFCGLKAVQDF